ncbi:MAG: polyprenyl synthetase family protein [Bacteroidales bacterium]|nr:polyprenyl synthetase family protein [Bacteroidales bacterium]
MNFKEIIALAQDVIDKCGFLYSPNNLYEPIDYAMRMGGKRLRPSLLLLAADMYGAPLQDVKDVAIAVELYHNFTLLHDDLMDQSLVRRGKTTVYRKWNSNTAVLSGDAMFALSVKQLVSAHVANKDRVLEVFSRVALEVCEGQQLDMDFEQRDMVLMEEYKEMIRLKTAVLLVGALEMGAFCGNAPAEDVELLQAIGTHLGYAFQMQDDLLDVYGNFDKFGKRQGQDIVDRKKTYMLLKAAEMLPEKDGRALSDMYSSHVLSDDVRVERIMGLYDKLNLRSVVESDIDSCLVQILPQVDKLHASAEGKTALSEFITSMRHREV